MQRTPQSLARVWRERGFTLIELTVVIAIIAILAATLLPVITQPYIQERRIEAAREMGAIEEAIMGRPEMGDYGFLGTVGRVPNSVTELLTKGGLGAASVSGAGVPVGWQGPYLRVATNRPDIDPWGTAYTIVNVWNAGQLQWRIQSNGPDRAPNTSDDIYYPYDGATTWNSYVMALNVNVMQVNGGAVAPVPDGTQVQLLVASGAGGVSTLNPDVSGGTTTTINGVVRFSSTTTNLGQKIPFGLVGVAVGGTPIYRQAVALRPVSNITVYIPAASTTFTRQFCWVNGSIAGGGAGATGNMPCTSGAISATVPAGQVVEATFNGNWRSSNGTPCWAAINFSSAADIPNGTVINAGTYNLQPVSTSSTTSTAMSATRIQQFAGSTAITAMLYVQAAAGVTCTVDGGSMSLRYWNP